MSTREYTRGMDLSEFRPGPKVKDISGQQHGDFIIVRYLERSFWICRCTKCGAEKSVLTQVINRGQMGQSCRYCRNLFQPTEREHEVLKLVAQGKSNREIGRELSISWRTAQTHIGNLLAKFGARNRIELVIRAGEL